MQSSKTLKSQRLKENPVPVKIPRHIAIIMDGNGRWAKERNLPRIMGHRAGVEKVREIITASVDFGIGYLTLYAFSQENWKRPQAEIQFLMDLLDGFLQKETENLIVKDVCFRTIGHIEDLPEKIQQKIKSLQDRSSDNKTLTLTVALNYGSRREILDAVKRMAQKGQLNEPGALNEDVFSRYLDTKDTPDPDMLIRTSGEMRLSNFLLWQCSYSEFYISNKYWPDFTRDDLRDAIAAFSGRERRFGGIL